MNLNNVNILYYWFFNTYFFVTKNLLWSLKIHNIKLLKTVDIISKINLTRDYMSLWSDWYLICDKLV